MERRHPGKLQSELLSGRVSGLLPADAGADGVLSAAELAATADALLLVRLRPLIDLKCTRGNSQFIFERRSRHLSTNVRISSGDPRKGIAFLRFGHPFGGAGAWIFAFLC